ncbi:methyltransferase domain-containing protein [Rhodococcus spelaei]|uniref:Methyltransferase domain-containing protein n=1 Tax=Rhodococcus spelaei TaxID=2546320 RepID=A0A541B8K9_9NOCA|nr:class I SAM-dependent methyltransferase [Rhodococcus spelaei]TQF68646.1 methyltransferase domain-containing protein [Rhodococcus spelaei]
MDAIVNTAQAEAWNGYEGDHWAANQDRYDQVNIGFNDALLAAAAPGERDRVLDVGCGNGQTARLAARAAAGGHTTGLDLSEPMLARARATAQAEGIGNVSFVRGDAQVYPFVDAEFDVALSRFGIMFFADPVAAFANIRRALRPGGRIAFLSMRGLRDDLGTVLGAVADLLPWRPDESHTGPTSLADPARIEEVLAAAGFDSVRVTPASAEQVWGRDAVDAAEFLGNWGPVRFALREADAAATDRLRRALTAALRPFERDDAVRLRGTAWLVQAVRP